MGMFDDKKYLTGDSGQFKVGDRFYLHAARKSRPVTINGNVRDEVALTVSAPDIGSEQLEVFTSGTAIVGQVERMDENDRAQMPVQVQIGQLDAKPGQNAAHILRPVTE